MQHEESQLEFTGERFLPEVAGQIAFEHLHRYHFARRLVEGLDVLDVACGEGYGSDIVARSAKSVVGVDIAAEAVLHATKRYGGDRLRFVEASAAALPFADAQFDAVVSFETIEHHDKHEEMLSEIRRVLKPGGMLIISSPNKLHYSIEPGYNNPYHVKELFREEFVALVGRYFQHQALFGQRVVHGSLMVRSSAGTNDVTLKNIRLEKGILEEHDDLSRPLYDLVVASDSALEPLASSLFEATVHGMDPAGFYGSHLTERVSTADQRIGVLEAELAAARPERGVHEKLDQLLQARGIEAVLSADVQRLNRDLESTLGRLSAASQRLESLSASVEGLEAQLAVSRARLEEDETVLSNLERTLVERDAQIRELHNSFSWRSTRWLRALSTMLGGGRR